MKAWFWYLNLALPVLLLAACGVSPLLPPSSPVPTLEAGAVDLLPTPAAGTPTPPALPPPSPTPQAVVLEPPRSPSAIPTSALPLAIPDPAGYGWLPLAGGLERPIGLAHAGDGSERLYIIEQGGRIHIWQAGELLPQPFLDLSSQVDCCGERGLLGLAFHPEYKQNGYFFVNYTERSSGELYSVIARYQVSTDPNRADPASELRLLHILQPYDNHNGGHLAFGADGYLYAGLGDGGSAGDPLGSGQMLDTLLGKLLRLDVDGGEPYAIPPNNPFVDGGGRAEVWAYGLRNPWRFCFDRLTGDLYLADVGQNAWEEVNFLPAGSPGGANFGWNYLEGSHRYQGQPPAEAAPVMPAAEYSHELGNSVTGGCVYRGLSLPEWQGVYLYGDFASGRVWGLLRQPDGDWQNTELFDTAYLITSFGEDENGEIYLVDYNGQILRLGRK